MITNLMASWCPSSSRKATLTVFLTLFLVSWGEIPISLLTRKKHRRSSSTLVSKILINIHQIKTKRKKKNKRKSRQKRRKGSSNNKNKNKCNRKRKSQLPLHRPKSRNKKNKVKKITPLHPLATEVQQTNISGLRLFKYLLY